MALRRRRSVKVQVRFTDETVDTRDRMEIPRLLFDGTCVWKRSMKPAGLADARAVGPHTERSLHVYTNVKSGEEYRVELIDHTTRFRPGTGAWRRLTRELENYAAVGRHPHVATFLDVDYRCPYICIKMEHAKYDLHDFLSRAGQLKECVAQWLLLQLLHAVDYCHRKDICNCDIKLSNILVAFTAAKKPLLKLCSFSCSKQQPSGFSVDLTSPIGDYAYLAPEILAQVLDDSHAASRATCSDTAAAGCASAAGSSSISDDPATVHFDGKSVDVWCLGCVLFYMLFRQMPFVEGTTADASSSPAAAGRLSKLHQANLVIERIKAVSWKLPANSCVSDQCIEVLGMMLAPRESRCTLEQLWQHPWIMEHLPAGAVQFNADLQALHVEASLSRKLQTVLAYIEPAVYHQH